VGDELGWHSQLITNVRTPPSNRGRPVHVPGFVPAGAVGVVLTFDVIICVSPGAAAAASNAHGPQHGRMPTSVPIGAYSAPQGPAGQPERRLPPIGGYGAPARRGRGLSTQKSPAVG
jgi:hypothetical protein